jgi:hypothetical protein
MQLDLRPPAHGAVIKTYKPSKANPVSQWRALKEPLMETVCGRGRDFGEYGIGELMSEAKDFVAGLCHLIADGLTTLEEPCPPFRIPERTVRSISICSSGVELRNLW